MYCPQCGRGGQLKNTYCRRCGLFLPDLEQLKKREVSPAEHFTANTVLSVMTAAASLTLAATLYAVFFGRADTPVIIYVTAGFLTAMFAWQVQVIWRTRLLKKKFAETERRFDLSSEAMPAALNAAENDRPAAAVYGDPIPVAGTGRRTGKLKEKSKNLS